MGDRFSADGFSGAWRAGEVERERETGGMPLGKTPSVENQIVLRHVRERDIERSPGRGRQDDIVECAPRDDRLDGATTAAAEEASEGQWFHVSKVPWRNHTSNCEQSF